MDDEETRKKLKGLKDWYDYYKNRFFKRQGDKYRVRVREHYDQITDVLKYGSATVVAEFIRDNPEFKPRKKEMSFKEHDPERDAKLKAKYQPLSRSVYDPNTEAARKLKPNPDFVYEPSELVETGDLLKSNKPSEAENLLKQMEEQQLKESTERLSKMGMPAGIKTTLGEIPLVVSEHVKPDEMFLIPQNANPNKSVLITGINVKGEDIAKLLNKEQKQIKDTVDKEEGEDVWKGLFLNRGEDEL